MTGYAGTNGCLFIFPPVFAFLHISVSGYRVLGCHLGGLPTTCPLSDAHVAHHISMGLRVVCMPEEGIGEVMEKEDCIQALSGQIFMGMVSSQYQARLDIVRLIDGLVNACIRFVYFSLEDELKSKVSCLC